MPWKLMLTGFVLIAACGCDTGHGVSLDVVGEDGLDVVVSARDTDGGNELTPADASSPHADFFGEVDARDAGASPDAGPGVVMALGPAALDFGACRVGREARLDVQIRSRGAEPLLITGIRFHEERTSTEFSVRPSELMLDGDEITPENPLAIPPNDMRTLSVYYTPDGVNDIDHSNGGPIPDTGVLLIESNAPEPVVTLAVSGHGYVASTPTPVISCDEGHTTGVQINLHLRGDESYGFTDEIQRWEWRVAQPAGSRSVFLPSAEFPNPTFEVNVAGTYTFYLDVWDERGEKSDEPAAFEVAVVPCVALHIELLWSTPGDEDETDTGPFTGSDVDLHLIHPNAPTEADAPDSDGDGQPDPYFSQPYDCYWFNPHPDWGAFGTTSWDDPSLDRDDADGAGPENINLAYPENDTRYLVAVHYWNDHDYGASVATVRVYVHDGLAWESPAVQLSEHDLWPAAYVDWPSGTVTEIRDEGGDFRITPDYQHPMFFK